MTDLALDPAVKLIAIICMFAFVVWVMTSNRPPPPALLAV